MASAERSDPIDGESVWQRMEREDIAAVRQKIEQSESSSARLVLWAVRLILSLVIALGLALDKDFLVIFSAPSLFSTFLSPWIHRSDLRRRERQQQRR